MSNTGGFLHGDTNKMGKSNKSLNAIIELGLIDVGIVIEVVTKSDTNRLRVVEYYFFGMGNLVIVRITFRNEWADETVNGVLNHGR